MKVLMVRDRHRSGFKVAFFYNVLLTFLFHLHIPEIWEWSGPSKDLIQKGGGHNAVDTRRELARTSKKNRDGTSKTEDHEKHTSNSVSLNGQLRHILKLYPMLYCHTSPSSFSPCTVNENFISNPFLGLDVMDITVNIAISQ